MLSTKQLHMTLFLVILLVQQVPAQFIQCYNCYYDKNVPSLPGSDEDCLNDAEEDKVDTNGGYRSCFASKYFEGDDIVSVYRGGTFRALFPSFNQQYDPQFIQFTRNAGRRSQNYLTQYCNEQLCNSASSIGSVATVVASLVTVGLMYYKQA